MPRAPKNRPIPTAEAIRMFAEHHIVAVRKARRSGEIIAIKHAVWGWISPRDYYVMQEFHNILPQLVEGGYRIKAALWGIQLGILGVVLPVGGSIPAYATGKIGLSLAEGRYADAAVWSAALTLPFGDIWILYQMLADALGITLALDKSLAEIGAHWRSIVISPITAPVDLTGLAATSAAVVPVTPTGRGGTSRLK